MSFYSAQAIDDRKKTKKGTMLLPLLILVTLIGVVTGLWYFLKRTETISAIEPYSCYWDFSPLTTELPRGQSGTAKATVNIRQGASPLEIGTALKEAGVVDSAQYFVCYAKKVGAIPKFQAGYYEIPTPISLEKLVPYLESGKIATVQVTILEGLRADEIAQVISDTLLAEQSQTVTFSTEKFLALATDGEFVKAYPFLENQKTFEGYLFPDTYTIPLNADSKTVARMLLDTFNRKVYVPYKSQLEKSPLGVKDTIIMASLIERETTRNKEERALVADLLMRRVRDKWILGVDATLLYMKKDWKSIIYAKDKTVQSPYNSYMSTKLPPTAICSPGLSAIEAVLNPKPNDYWYYLHDNSGIIRYGKTYDDHLKNINQYLR